MLSTFTTEHGTLIIRTQDIREIADIEDGCQLLYWLETRLAAVRVQGSASEVLARLKQEEIEAIAAAEMQQLAAQQMQQRIQQGYSPVPLLRGKPGRG